MTITPTVSVILPVYNQERYIKETIESILAQTFTDFELLIIDNYSSDQTPAIISGFADGRIRSYKQEYTGFVAKTRNYGITLARGKYVAFIDGDDLWLPEKLQKFVERFGATLAGLVYSPRENIDAFGKPTKVIMEEKVELPSGDVYESLLWNSFLIPSALMVRRDVLDKVGGFESKYTVIEDYEWFLRVARKYPFECINEPLTKYRVHAQSSSFRFRLKGSEILRLFSGTLDEYGKLSRLGRKGVMRQLALGNSLIGRALALEGEMAAARRFLAASLAFRFSYKGVLLLLLTLAGASGFKFAYNQAYKNIK